MGFCKSGGSLLESCCCCCPPIQSSKGGDKHTQLRHLEGSADKSDLGVLHDFALRCLNVSFKKTDARRNNRAIVWFHCCGLCLLRIPYPSQAREFQLADSGKPIFPPEKNSGLSSCQQSMTTRNTTGACDAPLLMPVTTHISQSLDAIISEHLPC